MGTTPFLALLLVKLCLSAAIGGNVKVIPYPVTPGAILETRVKLTVENSVISMEQQVSSDIRAVGPPPRPSSRARFATDAVVKCNFSLVDQGLPTTPPILRTQGLDIPVTIDHSTGSYIFALSPGHYYMRVEGFDWFYFWIEPTGGLHPRGHSPVLSVRDLGVKANTGAALTAQLQHILDTAFSTGDGTTVRFPQVNCPLSS